MGFSAYEYEYTYHLVCLNNSHYSNACTASCCTTFAVIAPYWEESNLVKCQEENKKDFLEEG